ncbi:MAG TPA: inositol monophosphatase family protein [Planctomycetota bacterium]|nr:inositol monophosphatase family protein [Planctomycetota bacterium]
MHRELEFAKRIVTRAGKFLRKNQGGRRSIAFKEGAGNLVTDMDHASEEMIVRALNREFPDHAIVAEERGASGDSPYRWYIDPVDGTTNYAHGFPIWAVTMALEVRGRLEVGVTYAPCFGDLYWARRGGGAYRNGKRIHVTSQPKLEESLLCTGFPYALKYRTEQLRYFGAFLMKAQAIRRVGAASLDLCWTAAGAFDGFWEMRLGPWDMAAGVVILREAGAKITNFEGKGPSVSEGMLVAANPRLHRQMLAVLGSVRVQ